jgi:hypothetical protein
VTPPTDESAAHLLACYPHVAGCPTCRWYAAEALLDYPPSLVLWAVLAHHEQTHRGDPLVTATQHFALDEPVTLA